MRKKFIIYSNFIIFYNFVWVGIPIIYLIAFKLYSSNRKVYIKAFKYVLVWLVLFCIPKFIGWSFLPNTCYNCALNNVCEIEKKRYC